MPLTTPLHPADIRLALARQQLSLDDPLVKKTTQVLLALMVEKKLTPVHYLLVDKAEQAHKHALQHAATLAAPPLTIHRFYDQAIDLACATLEQPTDEHIEAIAQRLLWNAQRGHGEEGVTTLH